MSKHLAITVYFKGYVVPKQELEKYAKKITSLDTDLRALLATRQGGHHRHTPLHTMRS